MKEYDDALYRFSQALKLKNLPLISWDIYGLYFDSLCKNYDDIVSLTRLSKLHNWSYPFKFDEALLKKDQVVIITDIKQHIVYATHNITAMNGYLPAEIEGRRPNIFQGPLTDKKTTTRIKSAIRKRVPFEAVIVNYRKNGTTYKCWLRGEPIFDIGGELVNFVAYEKEVA